MLKKIGLSVLCLVLLTGLSFGQNQSRSFIKSTGDFVQSTETVYTPAINGLAEIYGVTLHYNDAWSDEDIEVAFDSGQGATFDTVVATSDSVMLQDFYWAPGHTFLLQRDDDLKVTVGPGSGSEGYTITINGEYR